MTAAEHDSRARFPSRLYAILDADVAAAAGWTLPALAARYVAGGARFLQIRAKQIASGAFLDATAAIIEHAHSAGAMVIVNDRADVALIAGADGVHLGQDDLSPASVRRIVGDGAIVGWSTHSIEQVERALEQPISYVAVGPVFGTGTKQTGYDAVGTALVRAAASTAAASGLPVVAIGGITLDRALDVIAAGAAAVAVISDLVRTGDPEARVREYLSRLV